MWTKFVAWIVTHFRTHRFFCWDRVAHSFTHWWFGVPIYIGTLLLRLTCSPRIAYCKSNHLLILLDCTEICFFRLHFERKNNHDRHDLGLISKKCIASFATRLISHYRLCSTGTFKYFRSFSLVRMRRWIAYYCYILLVSMRMLFLVRIRIS